METWKQSYCTLSKLPSPHSFLALPKDAGVWWVWVRGSTGVGGWVGGGGGGWWWCRKGFQCGCGCRRVLGLMSRGYSVARELLAGGRERTMESDIVT